MKLGAGRAVNTMQTKRRGKYNKKANSLLLKAVEKGGLNAIKLSLNKGADPNHARKSDGATPLILAAMCGHEEVMQYLSTVKGVDPNKSKNYGAAPLLLASEKGYTEVVKLLLEKGADPNQGESDGVTPLQMAAQEGHKEVVKLLLEMKADPNQANNSGVTSLLVSAQQGHIVIVKTLLENGADPNQANNAGNTPLMNANKSGHIEVKELLSKCANSTAKCRRISRINRAPEFSSRSTISRKSRKSS